MEIQELLDLVLPGINVTPRQSNILVLPLMKATKGRIIDTEENRDQPEPGIVLAIGPGGVGPETGRPIPITSKVGDVIYFGKYSGLTVDLPGPKEPLPVLVMEDAFALLEQDGATFELVMHDDNPRKIHRVGLTCELCEPEKIDMDAVRRAGAGESDVIDAEVSNDHKLCVSDEEDARKGIEAERERLRAPGAAAERV